VCFLVSFWESVGGPVWAPKNIFISVPFCHIVASGVALGSAEPWVGHREQSCRRREI
jgi:hypothetical protein